jgi:serine/threonine protein kinase
LHGRDPPVIHRDFTPDNLIFANCEILKLIDFNVAQQLASAGSRTVVGKHAYIPPEQFRGKATIASDIYALGATMFFLLTGSDPEPITTSHPQELRPEITAELDAIVAKATSPNESERYTDAREIRTDLMRMKAMSTA